MLFCIRLWTNSRKDHLGKARGVILVVKVTLPHLWLPTTTNSTTNNQSNTDRQADLHYRETKNLYPKKLRTLTSKERFEELSYLVAQLLWRWFGVANITHQAREIAAGNVLWITQGILNGKQKPRVLVLNIGQPWSRQALYRPWGILQEFNLPRQTWSSRTL